MSWGELPFDKLLSTRKKLSNSRDGGRCTEPSTAKQYRFPSASRKISRIVSSGVGAISVVGPGDLGSVGVVAQDAALYAFTYSKEQCLCLRDQVETWQSREDSTYKLRGKGPTVP